MILYIEDSVCAWHTSHLKILFSERALYKRRLNLFINRYNLCKARLLNRLFNCDVCQGHTLSSCYEIDGIYYIIVAKYLATLTVSLEGTIKSTSVQVLGHAGMK